MKKIVPLFLTALFLLPMLKAQLPGASDSSFIISLNQQIDKYVIEKNTTALDTMYAEDFVFSHGSGLIEGKQGWLKTAASGNYMLRQHDSVKVEMHPGLAILRGNLLVHRMDADKPVRYHLKYIRVYAFRNKRWQMISHITTWERHEAF
jgi:hypothetical protein